MERRYLLDLVAEIKASGGSIGDEVFVSARRMVTTGTCRTARPLSGLVERGVLALSTRDGRLRGVITEAGCQLLRRWFATKPPDFTKRFPRLCREFRSRKDGFDGSCDEATRFMWRGAEWKKRRWATPGYKWRAPLWVFSNSRPGANHTLPPRNKATGFR